MLEVINIIDGNKHIDVYIKDNKLYVVSDSDYDNIYDYLALLKTNDIESFYSFGQSKTLYKGKGQDEKKKVFHIGKIIIVVSLAGLLAINQIFFPNFIIYRLESTAVEVPNYNPEDLKNMIYSSSWLTDEEKEYLYNEEFLCDILELVNNDNYLRYMFSLSFNNIKINNYERNADGTNNINGYYNPNKPNMIYIKDYEELTEHKKDTLAHEFVHLCQDTNGYNLIIEASAEIISNEYFNTPVACYTKQVALLKMLMEIIGPEPIWIYNFTGDFSNIESRVKPYLTNDEYKEFLSSLTFDYSDYGQNAISFDKLEKILYKLYYQIYNDDMDNNTVISILKNKDKTLSRYYFNKRYISEEFSYYVDKSEGEYKTLSLSEAMDNKLIYICSVIKTPLEDNEAIAMANTNKSAIERKINYKSADIIMKRSTTTASKYYFTGKINDVDYEECDIDELVLNGILDIEYYLIEFKYLTADEYLNHEYSDEATIRVTKAGNTEFNGETVYGFVPKKVYITPTNEIHKNMTLKKVLE